VNTASNEATEDEIPPRRNDMPTAQPTIPPDDTKCNLKLAQPDNLPHIGLVGDTYTITVTGEDTNGRFCVLDMHIPPGGGPPPHRHDFEETFILLEGEMEATLRGKKSTVHAGETLNIPANAPHQFHNASTRPVRMLCICSPAGQEKFFMEVGIPVAARITPPPRLGDEGQVAFIEKVKALAPKYRTELLREAYWRKELIMVVNHPDWLTVPPLSQPPGYAAWTLANSHSFGTD
jgi:quercetin dioxygenase-like cupin family protein